MKNKNKTQDPEDPKPQDYRNYERRIAEAEKKGWRFAETGPNGKWWAPPIGEPFVATLAKDLPDYPPLTVTDNRLDD